MKEDKSNFHGLENSLSENITESDYANWIRRSNLKFNTRTRFFEFSRMSMDFFRSYIGFKEIYSDFKECEKKGNFEGCDIFKRVKDIEDNYLEGVKDRCHDLFRKGTKFADLDGKIMSDQELLQDLKDIMESDSENKEKSDLFYEKIREKKVSDLGTHLDFTSGLDYHILTVFRENVYQLENYLCDLKGCTELFEYVSHAREFFDDSFNEQQKLYIDDYINELRSKESKLDEIKTETIDLASRALERSASIYEESLVLLREVIEHSGKNRPLVKQMVADYDLVEEVFGSGGAEHIFDAMYEDSDIDGETGLEKAKSYLESSESNLKIKY
ncbi:MAG: hypothetical protein ACLFPQ_02305 [Candidatus Woesearchaeota archaeon]